MAGTFYENGTDFRQLGMLEPSKSYTLYGWGQENIDVQDSDAVTVYDSQNCDSNFPQVFCSIFEISTVRACSANLGSPLISVDSSLAGFVISDTKNCTNNGGKFILNYFSIGEYQDWIKEVSGAEKNVKISLLMISVTSIISRLFF